MKRLILVFVLAVSVLTSVSLARTWYITSDGTGDAPTIQAGVDSASVGDEIVLADGTFTGNGNRDIDFGGKNLTVRSESGNPEACIIDCDGSAAENHRGFSSLGPTGTLVDGITIMNGYHYSSGALYVFWDWGDVSIMNCRFLDNHADHFGGAITSFPGYYGVLRISDCVFSGNSADDGGGAIMLNWHFNAEANVEIDNCTFVDNRCLYGCIMYEFFLTDGLMTPPGSGSLQGDYVRFTNCTIVGNSDGVLLWQTDEYAPAGLASGGSAPLQEYWCSMSQTIIAYNDLVRTFIYPAPLMTCVDIYGNSCGDWVGAGWDQHGIRGNFSACPSFCNAEAEDFYLCDGSPCAPGNHPDGYDCGLIGALDVGCVCGPSATESSTWGGIKSLYR